MKTYSKPFIVSDVVSIRQRYDEPASIDVRAFRETVSKGSLTAEVLFLVDGNEGYISSLLACEKSALSFENARTHTGAISGRVSGMVTTIEETICNDPASGHKRKAMLITFSDAMIEVFFV